MTWTNRIEGTKLEITTGDGETYFPLWKEPKKQITYNVDGFDFIGVEGTFVQRENRQGAQYPLVLFFQGEDNIEQSNSFEKSARDKKSWKIKHPLYDTFFCQPLSMEIDDTNLNCTIITVVVWETIDTKYPQALKNIQGATVESIEVLNASTNTNITENLKAPDTSNISKVTQANNKVFEKYNSIAKTNEDKNKLKGLFREASGAIQNITNDISSYMTKTQALINFPFVMVQTIELKINRIIDQFNDLKSIFIQDNPTDENKQLYEANATTQIGVLAGVASAPQSGDYNTKTDVLRVATSINSAYSNYKSNLDSIGYNQNPDVSLQTDILVNTTLESLYNIAFNSKQERIIYLDKDTNLIILAHRYFGTGDENITKFIDINKIELDEYLQLKKGRKIKYLI